MSSDQEQIQEFSSILSREIKDIILLRDNGTWKTRCSRQFDKKFEVELRYLTHSHELLFCLHFLNTDSRCVLAIALDENRLVFVDQESKTFFEEFISSFWQSIQKVDKLMNE